MTLIVSSVDLRQVSVMSKAGTLLEGANSGWIRYPVVDIQCSDVVYILYCGDLGKKSYSLLFIVSALNSHRTSLIPSLQPMVYSNEASFLCGTCVDRIEPCSRRKTIEYAGMPDCDSAEN